jgi:hypothetical protein
MAIFLIPFDYNLTKKLPPEALNVQQERYIEVKVNIEEVFLKVQDILKGFKSLKKMTILKEMLTVSARTKTTYLSFGEKITLKFEMLSDDFVGIHIESCPALRFTLLDYGKNFTNIEYLSKEIREKIGEVS